MARGFMQKAEYDGSWQDITVPLLSCFHAMEACPYGLETTWTRALRDERQVEPECPRELQYVQYERKERKISILLRGTIFYCKLNLFSR